MFEAAGNSLGGRQPGPVWPQLQQEPLPPALAEVFRAHWAHVGRPGRCGTCEPRPSSRVWLGTLRPSAPALQRASTSPLPWATWTFLLPLQVSLGK